MRNVWKSIIFLGVLTLPSGRILAIVTENPAVAEAPPASAGYSLNLDYVYRYKGASCVAISRNWILTSAHLADDAVSGDMTIGGETYAQQEIIAHPSADLALVRFDKAFPGYYPLHTGEIFHQEVEAVKVRGKWVNQTNTVYDTLVMAGYGFSGTVSDDSFTQTSSTRVKRWGTNRASGTFTKNMLIDGVIKSTTCLQTVFTRDDTEHEAGANTYDSGGPVFIESGSDWQVAGILLYRNGLDPYNGNQAALVGAYITWITDNIPEYDGDMDCIPDCWEQQYSSSPDAQLEPDLDADNDGFSNYDEWVAGTDPTNSTSRFEIEAWSLQDGIGITTSADREYQIERNTGSGGWEPDGAWIAGTGAYMQFATSDSADRAMYRLQVRVR